MTQLFFAGLLVLHGLITTIIGLTSLSKGSDYGLDNPSWLSWWPTEMGRSWLLDALPFGAGFSVMGDLIWVAAGLGLMTAGLGWLGATGLNTIWESVAFLSAGLGLLAIVVYFHPLYLFAALLNITIFFLAGDHAPLAFAVGILAKKTS
jgi:hypothetical protein